jgi:hypothetical protein
MALPLRPGRRVRADGGGGAVVGGDDGEEVNDDPALRPDEEAAMSADPIVGGISACRPAPIMIRGAAEGGFRLMSDLHIGASRVNYRLIKEELADALANGDRVLLNGDVFDLILAADKKRFDPDVLHPKLHGRRDIVDSAIPARETATKRLFGPALAAALLAAGVCGARRGAGRRGGRRGPGVRPTGRRSRG